MLKSLGKSVVIYGVFASLSKFIGIFLIPVFSRYFEPEEYGALDLVMTLVSLAAIFGMLQVESAIARFYYETEGMQRKLYVSAGFWAMTIVTSMVVVLVILLAPWLSELLFDSENYTNVIRFSATNILVFNIFGYLMVLIRFAKKPVTYGLSVLVQFSSTFLIAAGLVAFFDFKIIALFIGQLVGLILGILILLKPLRKLIIWNLNKPMMRELYAYSVPQVPATAGKWVNTYANRFVMLGYLSVADIGIYTVAIKIASIFNLIDSAFKMAWAPFIYEKLHLKNHRIIIRDLGFILCLLVFGCALLAMLFTRELVFILSTEEYYEAIPVIKILFFAFSLLILIQVLGLGSSIAKKTINITYAVLAATVVNIGLLFLLVPAIGLIGVPISLAVGNLVLFGLRWYYAEKHYFVGFNFKKIFITMFLFSGIAAILYIFEISLLYKILFLIVGIAMIWINRKKIIKAAQVGTLLNDETEGILK